MALDIQTVLTGVLVALSVYLIRTLLVVDKKVAVLCAEVKHLQRRIEHLEKKLGECHGSGSDRQS